MKLGADKTWKVALAVAVVLIGIWVVARAFAPAQPAAAAKRAQNNQQEQATNDAAPRARAARTRQRTATIKFPQTLDPTLRLDVLQAVESLEYEGKGRNIFSSQAEPPPRDETARTTPPPPANPGPVNLPPSGPPPPPPINLKFFGMASKPGQAKKVFLSSGEDIFIGGEGDIINRRYRIIRIGANTIEVEDVLNNNRQTISMSAS